MLLRASICALVDIPDEVELAKAWLHENRALLTLVSDMNGCGCCVYLWDVEGSEDVIKTIPPHLVTGSDWASSSAISKP